MEENNFNNKGFSKKNLGIIIGGVVIAIGAITTIIVSNVVSNERSNSNNDHAQQSEVQQNEIQNNQKEEKYTYKGSVLRALDKEFLYSEGEIKDVYGDIETYLLIGNGVYTMSRKELEKQYEVSSNATKILQCSGSSCIIETSDGKIEIYGADYEVKDIETQGEFGYGYKGVATPNYNLITLENGELTLNQFNLTTKENKTEEKLPIRIWNSKSPTQYEGKAKYYDGDVILLDNNDLHYLDRSTKNITNTEEPKAKNVEKVISKSSASYFKTPFYAMVGDNKKVYVLSDEAKHPYYNDTEHLISIELIDDYVTSDIKNLYEESGDIIIEFNDNKFVYYDYNYQDRQYSNGAYINELNELSKENHIKMLEVADGDFLVLCDDGKIYEINTLSIPNN